MGKFTYIGPDGKEHQRVRTTKSQVPDLDSLSEAQLQAFRDLWKRGMAFNHFARLVFPDCPIGFRRVARNLWHMADDKLHDRMKSYEQRYNALPPFAQFRRNWNLQAVMLQPVSVIQKDDSTVPSSLKKTTRTVALLPPAEGKPSLTQPKKRKV